MYAQVLDNPLWHMLCHELAEYAVGTALAKRGAVDIFDVAALADHSDAALADLATLYSPGEVAVIFQVDPPADFPGFESSYRSPGDQLLCQQRIAVPQHEVDIVDLTAADIADMQQLIDLTTPGPFFPGLVARRHFVGIRQAEQLVAMAGERLRLPGYGEISAVCTHPDWRGRGYASLLTLVMADAIWTRGDTPFLHVVPQNTAAYRIYDLLRFVKRAEPVGCVMTRT